MGWGVVGGSLIRTSGGVVGGIGFHPTFAGNMFVMMGCKVSLVV